MVHLLNGLLPNGIMKFASKWIELENIILSEVPIIRSRKTSMLYTQLQGGISCKVRETLLQSTHPKKLRIKEGSRRGHMNLTEMGK